VLQGTRPGRLGTRRPGPFHFKDANLELSSPTATALYLCSKEPALVGSEPAVQASVLQHCMYSENELKHFVAGWVNPTQGGVEGANPGTLAKAKDCLLYHLQVMDKRLLTRTYLVGERVSLADLVTCLHLLPA